VNDAGRARRYSRLKDQLGLAGTALGLLLGGAFIRSGLAARVARRLLPRRRPDLRARLVYAGALATASWLAGLPLAFINGYIVEQRFGLSRQTLPAWLADQLKAHAIGLALGLPLVEGLYAVLRGFPRYWWLVVSAAAIPLTTLMAQLFPVVIAPRFNTYAPLDDEQLAGRLERLAARSGIDVAGVMTMDMSRRTSKANAFFAGLGATRRIVLSDTLLERFTPQEIEAVVAHEIAHQANRDLWRFIALGAALTLAISAAAHRVVGAFLARFGRDQLGTRELADIRSLPALGLAFSVAGLLLTPLQLAYSREIERRADAFALALTRDPDAFSSAMMKLAETNLADPAPSWLRVWLLYSHPPIVERVARAGAARPLDPARRRNAGSRADDREASEPVSGF
jgi:STE24 endopeptidase